MPDPGYFEERLTNGVRLVLPRRQLGTVRRWGWALCGVAAFGSLFMVAWMAVPVTAGLAFVAKAPLVTLAAFAFAALGLAGLLSMLKLLVLGWAIVHDVTFTEVRLRDGHLVCIERFCGLKYKRRCKTPADDWQSFAVEPARLTSSSQESAQVGIGQLTSSLGASSQMLVARWGTGTEQQFTIAGAYPHEVLCKLMRDLQSYLRHVSIAMPAGGADSGLGLAAEARQTLGGLPSNHEEIEQPPGSDVIVERREDGMTLSIPPAGVIRGSKGLFVFSVFWNGLIGVFVMLLSLAALGFVKAPQLAPWVGFVFLLPFVAVGVGTLLAAVNMGIRKTALATSGGQLFVARTGLFGKRTQRWSTTELLRIEVANSGMAVNQQPIKELQIHGGQGKTGILSERPEMELRWIAAELNRSLCLETLETTSAACPAD